MLDYIFGWTNMNNTSQIISIVQIILTYFDLEIFTLNIACSLSVVMYEYGDSWTFSVNSFSLNILYFMHDMNWYIEVLASSCWEWRILLLWPYFILVTNQMNTSRTLLCFRKESRNWGLYLTNFGQYWRGN